MESIKTTPSKLSCNYSLKSISHFEIYQIESRSPMTPLYPYAGRFNFSPSAINRLLAQDVMPTVLKKGRMAQRVFTPNRTSSDLCTPLISPILPDYKIPANSPANLKMPPPKLKTHLKHQVKGASLTKPYK